MARTELQAAIVETIRQSLPKGLTIRGGPRRSFYKAGIYARYPADKGRGYYFIAKILIRPNGIIRGTIGKGRKVDRKKPHPERMIVATYEEPGSIERIEEWTRKLSGIILPWTS